MARPTSIALVLAAATAGAVIAATPARAQDASLGRLFHTPQQRSELEKRRATPAPAKEPEVAEVREVLITVNGYVGRSSGKTTTWVNGVPQYDTVRSADPTRVPVDTGEGARRVKVGATVDTNRGDVRDVIDGQIRVNPPRP